MSSKPVASRLTIKVEKPKEKKKINFGPRWDSIKRVIETTPKMPESKPKNPHIIQPLNNEISILSIHLLSAQEKRDLIVEKLKILSIELDKDFEGEKYFWKYKRKISKKIDYYLWRRDFLEIYKCLKTIELGQIEKNMEEKIDIEFNEKVKEVNNDVIDLMNQEYLWVTKPDMGDVSDRKFDYILNEKSSFYSQNLDSVERIEQGLSRSRESSGEEEEEIEINFDDNPDEEDLKEIEDIRETVKRKKLNKFIFEHKSSDGMLKELYLKGVEIYRKTVLKGKQESVEDEEDSSFIEKKRRKEEERQKIAEYLESKKPVRLTEDLRDPKIFRERMLKIKNPDENSLAFMLKQRLEEEQAIEDEINMEVESSESVDSSELKLTREQREELVKLVDEEKFRIEFDKPKNQRQLILPELAKDELRDHYLDMYNSFEPEVRKMFPQFNQYYGFIMSQCNHPMEWKIRYKQTDKILLKTVREEKDRLDEIRRIEAMKSESSVDWQDLRILGSQHDEEYQKRKKIREELKRKKEEEEEKN